MPRKKTNTSSEPTGGLFADSVPPLPCPCCAEARGWPGHFTGGRPSYGLFAGVVGDCEDGRVFVRCFTCGVEVARTVPAAPPAGMPAVPSGTDPASWLRSWTLREAVAAWNRRPEPVITGGEHSPQPAYDPDHPEQDVCRCGHTYYRHFDGYETPPAPGCKYCDCDVFESAGISLARIRRLAPRGVCCVPRCKAESYGSSPTCEAHQANHTDRADFRLPALKRKAP